MTAGSPGVSYVVPLRWTDDAEFADLTAYLRQLVASVDDVLVVDGSSPPLFARHAAAWSAYVRHLPPDPQLRFANGKVNGVTTGVAAARYERVVVADDDVRYDGSALRRVVELLATADLVRPQNVFDSFPWHARWDTARSLLNRAWTADYPGTFGIRRSTFLRMGGYDGDVLFENLELIRTLGAAGGTEVRPLDLYVHRRAPRADRFLDQRRRQAYDDLAQPGRLALWLSVLPAVGWALARRRPGALLLGAAAAVAVAEVGRRRAGGRAVYPFSAALMAPLWVLERSTCVWLALELRLRRGGVRYAGRRLRVAAHPARTLRRRTRLGVVAVPSLVTDRRPEASDPVGTVAERLDPGLAAAAQGDRPAPGIDLGTVRRDDAERAADEQGTVLVRRDDRRVLGRGE